MALCFKAEFRHLILLRSVLFFIFILIINGFIFYHLFLFPRCNENMNGIRETVGEEWAFFQENRLFW